jgi:hypothetical protein
MEAKGGKWKQKGENGSKRENGTDNFVYIFLLKKWKLKISCKKEAKWEKMGVQK